MSATGRHLLCTPPLQLTYKVVSYAAISPCFIFPAPPRPPAPQDDPLTGFMAAHGVPVEDCVVNPKATAIFSFPIKAPEGERTATCHVSPDTRGTRRPHGTLRRHAPPGNPCYIPSCRFSTLRQLRTLATVLFRTCSASTCRTHSHPPAPPPAGAVTRDDVSALSQLQLCLAYQRHWCEHKPSITVTVREEEWMEVGAWVYSHFDELSGEWRGSQEGGARKGT